MDIYGTYNADGSVQSWPETDINGNPYSRPPAVTHRVGDRFVVLPAGFTDTERLDALKPSRSSAPSRSSKSDDDD